MNDYACAILHRRGKILLGKRSPSRRLYPNLWDVLGGRVEPGETTLAALARELGEEIGLMPTSTRYLATLHDQAAHLPGILNYHMYLVEDWEGGEPAIRNAEHTALAWFDIADAAALPDLALESYRTLFLGISA